MNHLLKVNIVYIKQISGSGNESVNFKLSNWWEYVRRLYHTKRKRSIGHERRLKIVPFGIFKENHELRKGPCYATHTIQSVRIVTDKYL